MSVAVEWTPLPTEYDDFRVFLRDAWEVLGLPEPTPAQYRIAWFLQNSSNRRRGIRAFRGVGKSWISSVWVTYCLRQNPQYKILVVSASKERADNFTTFTRQLIDEWPILHCMAPRIDQRDSRISFDVSQATPDHAPSVKSVGITGQLSGSRADEIIADDVEVSNNSETQNKRDKLLAGLKEFDSILKPGGYITILGTPQTEDSVYTKLEEKGFTELIFPARYPKLRDVAVKYGSRLDPVLLQRLEDDPSLEGKPTDPARFSEQDLIEREMSIGRSTFALQFMLDTSLSDALKYPLKLSDLIISDVNTDVAFERYVHSTDPKHLMREIQAVGLRGDYFYRPMAVLGDPLEYTGTVMAIDPAGRGADETSYAVVKMLNGYLFVPPRGVGGLQGGYSIGVLEELAQTAKRLKVNTIIIESNFGDGMFAAMIKPVMARIHPVEIVESRVTQQKELRIIDTMEPILNQHRLVIDPAMIEDDKRVASTVSSEQRLSYQLFYQMSRLTKDKNSLRHDDRLDALATACKYWVDAIAQDANKNMKNRAEELKTYQLQSFIDGVDSIVQMGFMGMSLEQCKKARNHGTSTGIKVW